MKTLTIEGVGEVVIRKSSRAKRIILKIDSGGKPRITIPKLVPYALGERFAYEHKDWLIKNTSSLPTVQIFEGKQVGQGYTVTFTYGEYSRASTRIRGGIIQVNVPTSMQITDPLVQTEARKGCIRALRREAENVLPSMLHQLARRHGYTYREVRIKATRTRWGSCSSGKIINLSIWLMQVPDELIEYVICHELTHLNHMHHQADFWNELATMIPDYQQRRKALKEFRPDLM